MPRRVRNAHIETRSARAKVKPRGNPYWVGLEQGLHLGYRRLKGAGGKWVVRFYLGNEGKAYEKRVIGEADDYSDANGHTILTYDQAQGRARELMKRRTFAERGIVEGPYTVARAIEDYLEFLKASGKNNSNAASRARSLILPVLGRIEVADLTSQRLRKWLTGVAERPAQIVHPTDDVQRARRSSANRTLAILKAALNHAYDEKRVESNDAWGRRVKPFRGVEAARLRYLTVAEARRLINACEPDFRVLVQAALQTGCRFGELARMTVSDFNPDTDTVFVAKSKSGRARHVVLTDEGAQFFGALCVGRRSDERLFRAWNHMSVLRAMRQAIANARIQPITFHGLRHTWASLAVMNGVPLQIIAQNLGHTDTRMVEKHYGHMSRSHVTDAIRAGAPRFGVVGKDNVEEIGRGRRR